MNWEESSILITGGTGTFGQCCTRELLGRGVKRLVVYSRDEAKQHRMAQEIKADSLRFFIGDVRERDRLRMALDGIDVVIHAAALKHVPVCEYNPIEAVKTNVGGVQNVIEAGIDAGVSRVISLGTDKLVFPHNLYGATKLVAERLFIQGNCLSAHSGTRFSGTRYGNVIGSRGSVVEVFRRQRESGLVTVTDPRMTRFVLTVRDGVEFVLRSLEQMVGGEVFIPKLPSVGIMDVAHGVAPGCEVVFTGVRPGEKLHEMLISPDEARWVRDCGDYYVITPMFPFWTGERSHPGKAVGEGFCYNSLDNPWRLGAQEFEALCGQEEA